jgi:branched-chain amino acid transport system ATP-binding protein
MLRVSGLRSGYGRTPVLLDVDLEVGEGEIVAVLGRNGVGKSTLLRTITGLLPATAGRVELEERDVTRLRAHDRARLGLAYVPQGRQVFPRLTVLDNVRVAALAVGRDPRGAVEEALAEFPALHGKLRTRGESLSGGQQQQLALARALAANPRMLLLDEPSEGIQPSVVAEIAERLAELCGRRRVSVLLVEQNLDVASRLAGRAYVMRKGQVVHELPASRIAEDPDIQREYMGV